MRWRVRFRRSRNLRAQGPRDPAVLHEYLEAVGAVPLDEQPPVNEADGDYVNLGPISGNPHSRTPSQSVSEPDSEALRNDEILACDDVNPDLPLSSEADLGSNRSRHTNSGDATSAPSTDCDRDDPEPDDNRPASNSGEPECE
jgi:hypothetical protein